MTKFGPLFATLFCASAFSQNVQALLSLENGKNLFRSGEPIRLVLTFSSVVPGYAVNTNSAKMAATEDIAITPETGVNRWLEDYRGGPPFQPDGIPVSQLSNGPVNVALTLNDFLRIDGPGAYTVTVTTRRAMPDPFASVQGKPIAHLVTNPVTFTVKPMSDDEEKTELQRLNSLLADARRPVPGLDRQAAQAARDRRLSLEDELSYLAGDVATRAKLQQFASARGALQNLEMGLFIARNRDLVRETLENILRDPAATMKPELFHAVVRLRALASTESPAVDTRERTLADLVASLPQRAETNRIATLSTILANLSKDKAENAKILATIRPTIVADFSLLPPQLTLREAWDGIRDPSLAPGIEALLHSDSRGTNEYLRLLAISRLSELAPDRARPYVIAEITSPRRFDNFDPVMRSLTALQQSPIPDVDAPLLGIIRDQAALSRRPNDLLAQKAVLAAAFASDALYDPLLALYRTGGMVWTSAERAATLGYLARVHGPETRALIDHDLAALPSEQRGEFLQYLTAGNYSSAVREVVRTQLESSDPLNVIAAAQTIMVHGIDADRSVLEKRLAGWRNSGSNETQVELRLVGALFNGRAWTLSPDEIAAVRAGCRTDVCRGVIPAAK